MCVVYGSIPLTPTMSPDRLLLLILLGALLALPYLAYARKQRKAAFAIGLVIAALVYVAFAIAKGDLRSLGIELLGVAVFGALAFLAIRKWPMLLAFGWVAHVAWDLALHPLWWYPALCVGFDLVVAGFILGTLWPARTP